MKKRTLTEEPTILEAVDNLSSMAELEMDEIELVKDEEQKGLNIKASRWLDPRDEEKTITSVKGTFKVVHDYLKHVYTKDFKQLQDVEMQKGVKSIIALANEAAEKIDKYTGMFHGKMSILQSKEYRDLIDFYENKILTKFEEVLKSEEEWEEEWKGVEDAADIQRRGLKDLETVTRDRDYELFYITKEDGSKFYNKNLIRHIRLVADFDHLLGNIEGGDPLLQIKVVQDKVAMESASVLKEEIRGDLDEWLKSAGKYRDDPFIQIVFRTIMALFLASNPRNLLTQVVGKSSLLYFNDFLISLRESLNNVDYLNFIENPLANTDPFYPRTIDIIHKLCFHIFTYKMNESHAFSLFTRIIQRENTLKMKSGRSSLALWNTILDDEESLQNELKNHPSGPLFKVLDIIHDAEESDFDPLLQEDRPQHICTVDVGSKGVKVIKMACPTRQKLIQKASVIPEFVSFLRHIATKKERALLINFQDRTSWKEFARSQAVEAFQKNAEMKNSLEVVTMPKATDFYFQADEYIKNGNADEFKHTFLEQIKGEEGCGFYFPKHYSRKEIHGFSKKSMDMIHELFFGGKENLSRKNRLDFIEIFYNIFIMKLLDGHQADYLILSAKDGVDVSSAAAASFYAFSKLLSGFLEWKEEEKDYFVSLIFLPALLVRERPIDIRTLNRTISALAVISAELELNAKAVMKSLGELLVNKFRVN